MIKELLKDKKSILIFLIFMLFLAGEIIYPAYVGLILLFAFLLFGLVSSIWKDNKQRLLCLVFLILLSIANISINGIKFGIDFSGGTRISVLLEKSVDSETMNEILQIIKTRASVLGLTEVKVRAVGPSQIDIEVPGTNEELIKIIEDVLGHQGVFEGIVDGELAISGNGILPGSVYSIPYMNLREADWGVGFSVDKPTAENFAKTVKGKANYPLYMFLDRPVNAVVFISLDELKSGSVISNEEAVKIAEDALKFGNQTIELYILDEFEYNISSNKTKAIISKNLDNITKEKIKNIGFNLTEVAEISPVISTSTTGKKSIIEEWKAVGLLSAPYLSKDVTEGMLSYGYSITGSIQAGESAQQETKKIISILKGGSLPVQISLGGRTSIPAPLGNEFLQLSMLGVILAIITISIFVSLRYRQIKIIFPILGICIAELIILVSLLGSFTIDLAAMAGILAAIGVGVDAQIVITDELKKEIRKNVAEKLHHAFSIITTNVIVAVVTMLPILFSGMVEIIGFALSSIIGSLLGLMLSRPVYAILVEKIIE